MTVLTAILGIFYFAYNEIVRRINNEIALRKQLNEILDKLVNITIEIAKYRENKNKPTNDLPGNYVGYMNDYRRFYSYNAAKLVEQLKIKKTNSHQLITIAWAFDNIDDIKNARKFIDATVQKSLDENEIDKIIAKRELAIFLFRREGVEKATTVFENLLSTYENTSDEAVKTYISEACFRWAALFKNRDKKDYIKKLTIAKTKYEGLKSKLPKEEKLLKIESLINEASI